MTGNRSVFAPGLFTGKTVLVTGGGSGIGPLHGARGRTERFDGFHLASRPQVLRHAGGPSASPDNTP